jgi:transglutaminase-like putative cysteine protease
VTTPLPPPAAGTDASAAGPPPTGPERPSRRSSRPEAAVPRLHLLLAEAGLVAMTCAAVFGFGRNFASWSFLAPLLVVAVAGHATVAMCRRRGFGLPLSFLISAVEWVLVITWLFFVDTTLALIPTPDTLSTARLELDRSWAAFHQIVAPAPVQTGFLLAASVAVAGGAFLADWAAFRLWSAREALVPAVTLFIFATLLADDRHRTLSAVLMVGSAIAFLLAHRVVSLERSEGWVSSGRARAGRSMLAAGAVLAVLAVAIGALVAPHLPGVDEAPLVDWRRDSSASSTRMLTSPLVDLRARLVDTSTTPLFTVQSDTRSYWRIASLDQFDGTQWRLSANTDEVASGSLGIDRRLFLQGFEPVSQRFTIQGLQTNWLPAAYQPVDFDPTSGDLVRYDIETATLIGDEATSEGTTYDVVSILPNYTPAQLRAADPDIPPSIKSALALPSGFSPTAERIAREETAGAATHFEQALALQRFFRETGGFRYSTDVTTGQSTSAIDAFLRDRVGYCEQFAGSFAAMARSLGIPARVAVGYTWGEEDPSNPGTFQVLGRNAHAWPEVYLGEYGWVPFEPTPGRGNPDAAGYTGVPGTQDDGSVASTTTTTTAPEASSTTTSTPATAEETASSPVDRTGSTPDLAATALRVVVLLVVAAGLYLLAVPGSLAVRRRRRRARASGSPAAEVGVAWAEATETLAAAGVRVRPDETHAELAIRAAEAVPTTSEAMARLAAAADAAAYGPTPDGSDGSAAGQAAEEVRAAVDARLGATGRLRRLLDPRPLWEGRARRHRTGP